VSHEGVREERVLERAGFQVTTASGHAAALECIARQGGGSMRDAISLLDQLTAYGSDTITLAQVQVVLGIAALNLKNGRLSIEFGSIYLPLGGALLFAVSNVIRKIGTNLQPHAVLGAQSSTLAGLIAFGLYLVAKGGFKDIQVSKQNINWLAGSGVVNAFTWITLTMAINLGSVSVVTSIIYSYPLFSVLFSRLFLKDEPVDKFMVIGSVLSVLGIAVVSLLG